MTIFTRIDVNDMLSFATVKWIVDETYTKNYARGPIRFPRDQITGSLTMKSVNKTRQVEGQ